MCLSARLALIGRGQARPYEGADVVTEVAAGVDGLQVGERVMTYAGIGCFAEEVVIDAALVYPVPSGMSLEQAAGFALVYGTAYHGPVDRGGLREGETVAILGGRGLPASAGRSVLSVPRKRLAIEVDSDEIAVELAHARRI